MACPYFIPTEVWPDWTGPRRVPLGEPYRGLCAQTEVEIDTPICNFGYARGRCPHYPEDSLVDAVRFSMPNPEVLIWITERDHAPLAHGIGDPPQEYEALAQAFLRSYRAGKASQGIPK